MYNRILSHLHLHLSLGHADWRRLVSETTVIVCLYVHMNMYRPVVVPKLTLAQCHVRAVSSARRSSTFQEVHEGSVRRLCLLKHQTFDDWLYFQGVLQFREVSGLQNWKVFRIFVLKMF